MDVDSPLPRSEEKGAWRESERNNKKIPSLPQIAMAEAQHAVAPACAAAGEAEPAARRGGHSVRRAVVGFAGSALVVATVLATVGGGRRVELRGVGDPALVSAKIIADAKGFNRDVDDLVEYLHPPRRRLRGFACVAARVPAILRATTQLARHRVPC